MMLILNRRCAESSAYSQTRRQTAGGFETQHTTVCMQETAGHL
jgi:hypothetical protein